MFEAAWEVHCAFTDEEGQWVSLGQRHFFWVVSLLHGWESDGVSNERLLPQKLGKLGKVSVNLPSLFDVSWMKG